jgi:hypothetical protein
MKTALDDFLTMIPQTYSLHERDPYAAFMKGKEICTTCGEDLFRFVQDHTISEKIERTGEVYWIRKARRITGEHQLIRIISQKN